MGPFDVIETVHLHDEILEEAFNIVEVETYVGEASLVPIGVDYNDNIIYE